MAFNLKEWSKKYEAKPERKAAKAEAMRRFRANHPKYHVYASITSPYCYEINIANERYFGSSTQTQRWAQHLNRLKHGNHHNPRMQELFNAGHAPKFKKLVIGPVRYIKAVEYKLARKVKCINKITFSMEHINENSSLRLS